MVPQLFGRSFQKARNFTAISHQNAGFSRGGFQPPQKFSWGDTSGPSHRGGGGNPSRTQHPVQPLAGRGAQLFSRGCASGRVPRIISCDKEVKRTTGDGLRDAQWHTLHPARQAGLESVQRSTTDTEGDLEPCQEDVVVDGMSNAADRSSKAWTDRSSSSTAHRMSVTQYNNSEFI